MSALKELIGWKLVFGISGPEVDERTLALYHETGARGLILYRRNYRSPQQIKTLISTLESRLERRLLVTLDHEGGRVVFFGEDAVTVFPDNYTFGLMGDREAARQHGTIEARELRALGVDVNFSPVCDVIAENYNPGILSRSYSKSPEVVASFIKERIAGSQAFGLSATAKHFPGKGHTTVDAHIKLPVIHSTMKEMEDFHLKPFEAAMEAGVDCIMSSHPLYVNIDPDAPATFSRKIIHGLLREKYGYKGVIVSDDLEMGALADYGGAGAAIVKADKAGHDLLLVCHATDAQNKSYHELLKAYEDGSLKRAELEKSVERIKALFAKREKRFDGQPGPLAEGGELARRAAGRAADIINPGNFEIPVRLADFTGKTVFIYPRFADMTETLMWERGAADLDRYFLSQSCARGFRPKLCRVPLAPDDNAVARTIAQIEGADLSVIFVWDAGLHDGWRKVFEAAQSRSKRCIAILLRDFFDSRFALPGTLVASGYGFRKCQLDAVCAKVFADN
ncbi:MAG: beta-N-acetylhexosaminidase [Elusimicrobiales bacterium]